MTVRLGVPGEAAAVVELAISVETALFCGASALDARFGATTGRGATGGAPPVAGRDPAARTETGRGAGRGALDLGDGGSELSLGTATEAAVAQ